MTLRGAIDQPTDGALCYRQRIPVSGWVELGADHAQLEAVSAWSGEWFLGETRQFFPRADVSAALGLAAEIATGFRFVALLNLPQWPARLPVQFRARLAGGGSEAVIAERTVALHPKDYTTGPYGNVVNPGHTDVLHREHIYSSGRPSEDPSPDCVALLADYLPLGGSVLDVGCGVGAYAAPLRARGFEWTGAEVDPRQLAELARRGLPHHAIARDSWLRRQKLPFAEASFDAAIAIEVLEHIQRFDDFLGELRRVARKRVCISVPNLEVLPYWADRLAAPWHLLEADHKNFFSRFSLHRALAAHFRHVEVIDYGPPPLPSPEGVPLGYQLFAIADV